MSVTPHLTPSGHMPLTDDEIRMRHWDTEYVTARPISSADLKGHPEPVRESIFDEQGGEPLPYRTRYLAAAIVVVAIAVSAAIVLAERSTATCLKLIGPVT